MQKTNSPGKLINSFPKNSTEEVRTRLTEYRGYKLINIKGLVFKRRVRSPAYQKGLDLEY